MAEISREEAIAHFKQFLKEHRAEVQERTIDINDLFDAWDKMQKIEQIVEEMWDENSYYNNSVRFAEKIEQIVKGE